MPYNRFMKTLWLALMFAPALALGQTPAEVQKLFEAGRFQQVADMAAPAAEAPVLYLVAQSHQKLGATEEARQVYVRLADRGDNDPWHFIGMSGQQLLDNDTDAARDSARRAIELADDLAEAHYQLGIALARRQEWRDAAAAFDRVAEIRPAHAYAHYNGGLMHYRANRPDRMAIHFEQFLKLAPEAPERPEVLQIMRTIRGR